MSVHVSSANPAYFPEPIVILAQLLKKINTFLKFFMKNSVCFNESLIDNVSTIIYYILKLKNN